MALMEQQLQWQLQMQQQQQQAHHITNLGFGETTMCHITVKLYLFSGFDVMGLARDGCSVRRKHRCAKCVNNFAATCTTVHRCL